MATRTAREDATNVTLHSVVQHSKARSESVAERSLAIVSRRIVEHKKMFFCRHVMFSGRSDAADPLAPCGCARFQILRKLKLSSVFLPTVRKFLPLRSSSMLALRTSHYISEGAQARLYTMKLSVTIPVLTMGFVGRVRPPISAYNTSRSLKPLR